jgi:hypothetical protein
MEVNDMTKIRLANVFLSFILPLGCLPTLSAQNEAVQDMPNMKSAVRVQVNNNASGDHAMDMNSHIKMTSQRQEWPGDEAKAQHIVEVARKVCEKYKDYKAALSDGFEVFFPRVPQKQYHFNKPEYAREAAQHFNPEHPTSLLYEKDGSGYKLVGLMYTAPQWASEDELNDRIPLSIAQWHAHVNLCLPSVNNKAMLAGSSPKFGFQGSISTEADCQAAGGRFLPQAFGWMVHVYPFASTPAEVWSVERQMQHED